MFTNRELPRVEARKRRRVWYREEVFLDFDPVIDTEVDTEREPFEEMPDPDSQPPPDGPP